MRLDWSFPASEAPRSASEKCERPLLAAGTGNKTPLLPETHTAPAPQCGDMTQVWRSQMRKSVCERRLGRPQVSPLGCDQVARASTARVTSGEMRWLPMSSGQSSTSAAAQSAHCATSA
jgi:hypothetical protein